MTQSRCDDEVSRFDRLPASREARHTAVNKNNRDVTSYGIIDRAARWVSAIRGVFRGFLGCPRPHPKIS